MSKETGKNKLKNVEKAAKGRKPFGKKEMVRDYGDQKSGPSIPYKEGTVQKPLQYINIDCKILDEPEAKKDKEEHIAHLTEPQFLSTLRIAEEVTKVKNTKCKKADRQLHPQSNFKPKALKRINIPFEEQVYKDLVNLSVKDEDLGFHKNIPKTKEFIRPKDPDPILSDFYEPKFDKEYIVKCPAPSYEIEKVWCYNGFSIFDTLENIDLLL